MDGVESEIEQHRFCGITVLDEGHGFVGEQVRGVAAIALKVGGFIERNAVQPPVHAIAQTGVAGAVGEVIDGSAILAVVDVPAPILGQVGIALLNHRDGGTVDRGAVDVVAPAAKMPFATHVSLVARGFKSLRHEVFAQIQAASVAGGGADGVAPCEQA